MAVNGDRNAFGELIRLHRKSVINVVFRMCGDTEIAEDVAQDTFIRAWKNLHTFQPRYPLRNWLFRIASNRTLDLIRRNKPTISINSIPLASSNRGPEAVFIQKEQAVAIQEAVLSLSPASRAVIVLREYEGLSYREISEALEIPLGTVMSRLNYARKQLRSTLEKYLEIP
jgi:RNA polymerase sigma-70 factor (ECF subfamily)